MKNVYCVAVESESSGAVNWFTDEAARDAFALEFPVSEGDRVSEWTQAVAEDLTPEQITEAVDEAMWEESYTPTMRYAVREG